MAPVDGPAVTTARGISRPPGRSPPSPAAVAIVDSSPIRSRGRRVECRDAGAPRSLLVALTPALETLSGGSTPLMQDVLKLPSQRSILTVTRLGIMAPDPIDGRFHPDRLVNAKTCATRLKRRLISLEIHPRNGANRVTFGGSGCILLQEPMTGRHVTEALLTTVMEEPEA